LYHTKCIKKYIDLQEEKNEENGTDNEITCPTCRNPLELIKLHLVKKGKFTYLQKDKESLVRSLAPVDIQNINQPDWLRERELSDRIGTVMLVMFLVAFAWIFKTILSTDSNTIERIFKVISGKEYLL
jgi:hypothetical protein